MAIRAAEGGANVLEGVACPFDVRNEWYDEVVRKGAFKKTIREADVRLLYNHDTSNVLGRSKGGPKNLELWEEDDGLHFRCADLPDTTLARDVSELVRRQLVDGNSVGFWPVKTSTEKVDGLTTTVVTEAALVETSICPFPSYEGTYVEARDRLARMGIDIRELVELLTRADPSPEEKKKTEIIVRALRGVEAPEEPEPVQEPVQEDHSKGHSMEASSTRLSPAVLNRMRRLELETRERR
ncbi:MAG: hypothetical protein GHCLOJNM_01578 [bacterium]|nr:hypothetical protein [bacterium]